MATEFKEIYESSEILKNDNRIVNKPANQLYKLYYLYLKSSIGLFMRECYKDIKNHTPFSQQEYLFKSDGIDNTLLLSPIYPPENCNFYVGYSKDSNTTYTEITEYTYDLNTHTLTIPSSLVSENYLIYVSGYVIGSFNVDLEFDEQDILLQGMLIPFLQEQQNRNSLLTHMVYGASQKASSQGEHLKQIHSVVKDQEDKVASMIKKYSYSANPENLSKLGVGK